VAFVVGVFAAIGMHLFQLIAAGFWLSVLGLLAFGLVGAVALVLLDGVSDHWKARRRFERLKAEFRHVQRERERRMQEIADSPELTPETRLSRYAQLMEELRFDPAEEDEAPVRQPLLYRLQAWLLDGIGLVFVGLLVLSAFVDPADTSEEAKMGLDGWANILSLAAGCLIIFSMSWAHRVTHARGGLPHPSRDGWLGRRAD